MWVDSESRSVRWLVCPPALLAGLRAAAVHADAALLEARISTGQIEPVQLTQVRGRIVALLEQADRAVYVAFAGSDGSCIEALGTEWTEAQARRVTLHDFDEQPAETIAALCTPDDAARKALPTGAPRGGAVADPPASHDDDSPALTDGLAAGKADATTLLPIDDFALRLSGMRLMHDTTAAAAELGTLHLIRWEDAFGHWELRAEVPPDVGDMMYFELIDFDRSASAVEHLQIDIGNGNAAVSLEFHGPLAWRGLQGSPGRNTRLAEPYSEELRDSLHVKDATGKATLADVELVWRRAAK